MNSAVATVLNKVLGDWIEDLNPDDLNLSILRGDVTLTNLRVKGEALNKFGLPVEVKSGYIGRIVASIPWTSLNSSPLTIEISNVTVFLKPRPLDSWDSQVQKKNLIEGKLSTLEDFELVNQKDFAEAKDPGFFGRLVENIVDNIQISVKNVYVRLEDSVASTSRCTWCKNWEC
jgi:vacuolar protein sorting-associated protein 13A/C